MCSRDEGKYEVSEGYLEVALGEQGSHEVHPQRHHAKSSNGTVKELQIIQMYQKGRSSDKSE